MSEQTIRQPGVGASAAREVVLTAFGLTDVGLVRKNNEDVFVIADLAAGAFAPQASLCARPVTNRGVLLAVSDGMGGAAAGEVASALVVGGLRQHLGDTHAEGMEEAMRSAVEAANKVVWDAAHASGRPGMGATLAAVLVHDAHAYVASVGDSRVYLLRHCQIRQVTEDQSWVEMLVRSGVVTREQAEASPHRNVLLQAMGQHPHVTTALGRIELRRKDVFLLCSDGLWNKVTADEIYSAVTHSPTGQDACQRLVDMAKARGGEDNITVVLSQVTGEGLREPTASESVAETIEQVQEFDPQLNGRA